MRHQITKLLIGLFCSLPAFAQNGKIGINVTNPEKTLHVGGDTKVDGAVNTHGLNGIDNNGNTTVTVNPNGPIYLEMTNPTTPNTFSSFEASLIRTSNNIQMAEFGAGGISGTDSNGNTTFTADFNTPSYIGLTNPSSPGTGSTLDALGISFTNNAQTVEYDYSSISGTDINGNATFTADFNTPSYIGLTNPTNPGAGSTLDALGISFTNNSQTAEYDAGSISGTDINGNQTFTANFDAPSYLGFINPANSTMSSTLTPTYLEMIDPANPNKSSTQNSSGVTVSNSSGDITYSVSGMASSDNNGNTLQLFLNALNNKATLSGDLEITGNITASNLSGGGGSNPTPTFESIDIVDPLSPDFAALLSPTGMQTSNSSSGLDFYVDVFGISLLDDNGDFMGFSFDFPYSTTYHEGDFDVNGNISKLGGTFKIDHPLDPYNQYLYHSFVESPDMMNIYNGNITTNEYGEAMITLPDYFEALNIDFRYQLTVIGTFAQAIISEKIQGNEFKIKTDQPNVEVSWQVTGIRNDSYAQENRIVPEVEKEAKMKGKLLYNPERKEPLYMTPHWQKQE